MNYIRKISSLGGLALSLATIAAGFDVSSDVKQSWDVFSKKRHWVVPYTDLRPVHTICGWTDGLNNREKSNIAFVPYQSDLNEGPWGQYHCGEIILIERGLTNMTEGPLQQFSARVQGVCNAEPGDYINDLNERKPACNSNELWVTPKLFNEIWHSGEQERGAAVPPFFVVTWKFASKCYGVRNDDETWNTVCAPGKNPGLGWVSGSGWEEVPDGMSTTKL